MGFYGWFCPVEHIIIDVLCLCYKDANNDFTQGLPV